MAAGARPPESGRGDAAAGKLAPPEQLVVRRGADGAPVEETPFAADAIDGAAKIYGPGGRLVRVARFKAGQLDGETTEYDADGVLAGEMRSYDAAGALAAVAQYAGGRLDGQLRVLRPEGSPARVAHYCNGRLSGEASDYWDSGNIRQQALYRDGVQHGPTRTWLVTGEPDREVVYENGKPVATRSLAAPAPAPPAQGRSSNWIDRLIGSS